MHSTLFITSNKFNEIFKNFKLVQEENIPSVHYMNKQ